jgi:hypothetical protein
MSDLLCTTYNPQPGITPYSWTERALAAALSLSATANVAVTEWRNAEGNNSRPAKIVKFIATELLYAGIVVVGTLEALAKLVCSVVLAPLAIFAEKCLCGVSPLSTFAVYVLNGTFASGATAFDALFALKDNVFTKPITLDKTHAWTAKHKNPLHAMTTPVEYELKLTGEFELLLSDSH